MGVKAKKYIFAAGGTGGHINPAIAVAGCIRENEPNAEILFIGTADRMEAQLVPAAGYDFAAIEISGFYRGFSSEDIKHNIKTLSRLMKSSSQAKKIIREFSPHAVIGFGGYVSGPVLRAAAKMGIPTAIHEQNAYPGITNKALASRVDRVMLSVKEAEKLLSPKNPCVMTGLPVRKQLLKADRTLCRFELGLDEKPLVLSMGGSLGAEPINKAVVEMIAAKHKANDCRFIHATGKQGSWVKEALAEKGVNLEKEKHVTIREYIDDMERCLPAADLVICRAGASSLNEFQALGKASVLIPSPYVTENHQYHNAMALVNRGAAVIIEEKDLTGERLTQEVNALLNNPEKLKSLSDNAKKDTIADAAKNIYNVIKEIT